MYDVINSRYTYKGTDVLVNKLDIKDEKKLEKYERKMVAFKLATINEVEFPKVFDVLHVSPPSKLYSSPKVVIVILAYLLHPAGSIV